MNFSLIYPLFVMVLLTFSVAVYLLRVRVLAVRTGLVPLKHFRTYQLEQPTEDMVKAGRHYSNLFELPTLYYAGMLLALILPVEGTAVQVLAWLFVVARAAHAWIHLGQNRLRPRMLSFFVGWFAVLGLWIEILLFAVRR